ncbi:MAG TPA: hypothetical protein VJ571_07990 [Candidatus Nitrosotalea sp.]|nr:hypothetical protein [Candidatus Nitrosotalea sp.]
MRIHITITDDKGNQFDGDTVLHKSEKKASAKPSLRKKNMKPGDAIVLLYENEFFKEERKLLDVTTTLSKQGYNFNRNSVYMALEGADFLNKKGTRGSYKFVQKYPFNE